MMSEPNELTKAAMREGELLVIIKNLVAYAVWDEERNDECIDAIQAAKQVLKEASDLSFMNKDILA